ncbi:MAG: lipase maturation factor family protein [Polyangiales bacterium]
MSESSQFISPELVWGLFSRGLGLVYLISFTSLAGQMVRGAGRDGGLPISLRLRKIKQDFPTWRRIYYFPTLLWLSDSDAMLRALTLGGLGGAALLVYGGPFGFYGLLTCYLCYLSLDMAIGLIFPWDALLFEATVLGLFLPETHALPELSAVTTAAPALAWAYRLLLFCVMFGFGKQKFMGATIKDLAYLKGFLINQPLVSPLGWYVQKLPTVMLKPLVVFMFFAEVPAPCFAFFPGKLSLVFAACTVFLMIGIQAMGSFGYFSILTIVGCLPLLDNVTPGQLRLSELFAPGAPMLTNAFVLVHTFCVCLAFPFNSWVAQSWHLWSFWYRLPRVLQLPFDFVRFMHPFRWLHPYGVFPPNTSPGVKICLLVEVTWDNEHWEEVDFHYSVSNPKSPPKFIAPHHPRGDQAVIYETFGLNPTSLISSIVGPWDPYSYGSQPAANTLAQRITEGAGLDFMKGTVLKQHKEAPVAVRISTVMLEPVTLKEHFATGNWWRRCYIGPHTPPRHKDPRFWHEFLPEPEMWHYDAIFWRRRSKLNALMQRSRAGKEDPMQLAIVDPGTDALTSADVERFWQELVPLVDAEKRKRFDTLADVVAQVRSRFDREQQRALHRLLGRFSALLVARFEPLYIGRGLKPILPAQTYFHLWTLAQHIIANGRDAYLQAMADPLSAAAELPAVTAQSGLYLLSIFRFDSMVFEGQKLRLITAFTAPHDEEEKRKIAHSSQSMTGVARVVANLAGAVSGFFSVMPDVRDSFMGPRFDLGYPELYPSFEELPSGEVAVRTHKKPPEGVHVPLQAETAAAE